MVRHKKKRRGWMALFVLLVFLACRYGPGVRGVTVGELALSADFTGEGERQLVELAEAENKGLEAMLREYEVTEEAEEKAASQASEKAGDIPEKAAQAGEDKAGKSSAAADEKPRTTAAAQAKGSLVNRKKLGDFDYIVQNFYQVDNTTTVGPDRLNKKALLGRDMTLKQEKGEEPQILVYHTHSQETYKGCREGDASRSVVAVGERLTKLLRGYGYRVLHHRGEYDVEDRDNAYTYALPALESILEKHPSIQVIIDVHRDSVPEKSHLVTEINGKKTAQIMFFNGLSHTTALGDIERLPNENLAGNLAFSFQAQLAAAELYPGLTRKVYLKGYRYNMHLRPRSMLVEVGAQNNTFKEAKNAMEPLAAILHRVLSGE